MLKISLLESSSATVALRVEGRAIGPWVTELRHACEQALQQGRSLRLHLADVEFLEPPAAVFLAELCARGVVLLDCPPFIAAQLRSAVATDNRQ